MHIIKSHPTKKTKAEKSKARGFEILTPYSNNSECSKKAWKRKKKDWHNWNQHQNQRDCQEGSTPTTEINAVQPGK